MLYIFLPTTTTVGRHMNPKIELAEEMYITGRPWKGGNAVLLAIIQGKKIVILIFYERKTFHIYPESYVNETWKWACAILITFLAYNCINFVLGFSLDLKNNNGNEFTRSKEKSDLESVEDWVMMTDDSSKEADICGIISKQINYTYDN